MRKLYDMGQIYADKLGQQVELALSSCSTVLIAMHPPPFREATWHNGKTSSEDYLTFFTCGSIGNVLSGIAKKIGDSGKKMTVICGHTHSSGYVNINGVDVYTGHAKYGYPAPCGTIHTDSGLISVEMMYNT